jgi:hypothetical protein
VPEKAFTSDDWPTLLAPALAYVAVELDVHVGRVAYAYLRQSQHFVVPGKQHEDVVKNFFAPLIDGNRTFDPNAVWQHADFGGVLGHIGPASSRRYPRPSKMHARQRPGGLDVCARPNATSATSSKRLCFGCPLGISPNPA